MFRQVQARHPESGQPFFIYAGLVGSQIGKLGFFRILTYIFGKAVSQFEMKAVAESAGRQATGWRRKGQDGRPSPASAEQRSGQYLLRQKNPQYIGFFYTHLFHKYLKVVCKLSMVNGPPPRGDFP